MDLDGHPDRVIVQYDAEGVRALAVEAIRELVRAETGAEPEVEIEFAAPSTRAKRVRFDSIEVSQPQPGVVKAVAKLSWQREHYVAEAEGEASAVGELRACAAATMRAVERFAGGKVSFSLIGVKEFHVFDHDLVAVLLHAAELPDYRMIGTSIITEDRNRAAALAVLSATNRAVGNFLEAGG
ncbi:MAG TPA: hypothetical protein VMN39_04955 [Longimicrobiaceae bacterium]|nr:hypothetical protein [Longimicrobiaceae bacterium]